MLYRGYKKVLLLEEQNSAYDLLRHSLLSIMYHEYSLIEFIFKTSFHETSKERQTRIRQVNRVSEALQCLI